jgi:hypothetical protein
MSETKPFDIDEDALVLDALSDAINSMKDVSPLAPAVFELEKAIVNGLSDSYANESERLKQKYGKANARTREMDDLAADLKDFQREAFSGVDFVKRSAQTFTEENIFHGYAYDSEGDPAEGHTVVLTLKSERLKEKTLSSDVDSAGYFYIDLAAKTAEPQFEEAAAKPTGASRLDQMKSIFTADREVMREKLKTVLQEEDLKIREEEAAAKAREEAAAAKAREEAKAKAAQAAETGAKVEFEEQASVETLEIESEVAIEDPKGRVVLRDENPPVFTPPNSVFKRYQIDKASKYEESEPVK